MANKGKVPVTRTSVGLRDALFDELDDLRSGKSTAQKASSVSRIAMAVINSVKMEIEHQKHVASTIATGAGITQAANLQLGNE